MNSSEKIDQVATSLAALSLELKNPPRKATGAVFGGEPLRYADLPTVTDAIRPHLKAVGLAVLQYVKGDELWTLVSHLSGQWVELGPYPLPAAQHDQKRGGSITYGRRQTLLALFLLAGGDADPDATTGEDSADLEPAADSPNESTMADRMGEAEGGTAATGDGAPDAGEQAGAPKPADKQRWLEEFHPGKPHKMAQAPNDPRWDICTTPTLGSAPCPWAVFHEDRR